jgi:hypothetical protein
MQDNTTEAKLNGIIEELGLPKKYTILEEDADFFKELESVRYITDSKGNDWTQGDNYIIACETTILFASKKEDLLFYVYVDCGNLHIELNLADMDLEFLEKVEEIRLS